MKYEAIEQHSKRFTAKKMCKVFGINSSNYYRWKRNKKRKEEKIRERIKVICQIEKIFKESDKTYGYRAIQAELKKQGIELSEYRIRKIIRENGFYPETRTKYRPSHSGKTDGRYHANHLQQKFKVEQKNQVWVGDITYIKTKKGWIYLAAVIDLYNREVIGYTLSKSIDTELVKKALGNAIGRQGVKKGLLFHSDLGSQYASKGYEKMLQENGIKGCMSRGRCPYDNSCMESFFAT